MNLSKRLIPMLIHAMSNKIPQNADLVSRPSLPLIIVSSDKKQVEYAAGLTPPQWLGVGTNVGLNIGAVGRYIELTIDDSNNVNRSITIGVTYNLGQGGGSTGCWQYAATGETRGPGGYKKYGSAYGVGDRVGVLVRKNGTLNEIYFYKNGVNQGLAYSDLPNLVYFTISFYLNNNIHFLKASLQSV